MSTRYGFAAIAFLAASICLFPSSAGAQSARVPATFHALSPIADPPGRFQGEPGSLPAGRVGAVDTTLPTRLQKALDKALTAVRVKARRGLQASVIAPGLGQWVGVTGTSDSGHPITPAMRFEIGSVSKTFTGAVILQLIDEGKISLDDTVGKFLPGNANIADSITIRELMTHASGLFDYLNNDTAQTLLLDAYFYQPTHKWTPEEILTLVHAPIFAPGTDIQYSNTNYVLLGMIAEKLTGKSIGEELHRRFLTPLGLDATYAAWDDEVKGELAHGWSIGFDATDPTVQKDISDIPTTAALSSAWTAGGMVSTAADLARWGNALWGGHLLSAETMEKAFTTVHDPNDDLGDVGLAVFRTDYKGKTAYFHTGGVLGYSSIVMTIPADSVTVAVVANSFHTSYDAGTTTATNALLTEVYRAVASVADADAGDAALTLAQNYPNPFRDGTTIRYAVPARTRVTLQVIDALGRVVDTPVDEMREPGSYVAEVRLPDAPAGSYFYRLRAGGRTEVRAMRLVR